MSMKPALCSARVTALRGCHPGRVRELTGLNCKLLDAAGGSDLSPAEKKVNDEKRQSDPVMGGSKAASLAARRFS